MADEELTPEDSGEMTQADIDAAFGGASAENAPPSGDSAEMSQADIDAAINAGVDASATPEPAAADGGALSQADIDAALAGEAPADTGAAEVESVGELSQADIDAALGAATSGEATSEDSAPPVDDRVDATGRPFDAAAAAMAAAIEEEKAAAPAASPPETSVVELQDFAAQGEKGRDKDHKISLIQDVDLRVKIELGRTRMLVEDVLTLGEGSVVELDKLAGDPVDVFVNDRLVARGEVLVLNDNFCVRISEIVSNAEARQVG